MRGWSSRWPVSQASPVICSIVWAKPVLSRHGPESPKAGMRRKMQRGFSSWIASQPRSKFSITRGVKFSTTASHFTTRRRSNALPSSVARSIARSVLLVLPARKNGLASHQASNFSPSIPPIMRIPSGRLADSTWITSAPSAAIICAADGPAHQAVRSSTRSPASGSPAAPVGLGRRTSRDSTRPVCSPSRGAGRCGAGSQSSSL